jgi:CheY-like chemotaxis protein
MERDAKKCEDAGFDGFFAKPVRREKLIKMIQRLLGNELTTGRKPVQSKIATQHSIKEEAKQSVRILLAEDNPVNQKLATLMLKKAGYQVEVANNGKVAFEKYTGSSDDFDLIFMDIQMPEMDGLEATSEIRKWEGEFTAQSSKHAAKEEANLSAISYQLSARSERVPIIAMTAHAMEGDRENCIEAGMDDYIAKPVEPVDLFSKLDKWVKPGTRQAAPEVHRDHDAGEEVEDGLPSVLPGIDIEIGLRRLAGNTKLFKKLLKAFSSEFANTMKELRNALDDQEMELAYRLVHTLKGVAGNISAKDLQAEAQELEIAIKQGVLDRCDILLGNVEKALGQVLESIRAMDNRGKDG